MSGAAAHRWLRRARPLLGTLVEVGIRSGDGDDGAAFAAAFSRLGQIQSCLSRFEADSDIGRFAALRCGEAMTMRQSMREVIAAAQDLRAASGGSFDITAGSAPGGWRCRGDELRKLDAAVRLDLGGIGKGYAVDRAVDTLMAEGCSAGWVNAGGDLRVFGDADLPVCVRDESLGGVRRFASLRDGAFATSHFDAASRSRLARNAAAPPARAHVSVVTPPTQAHVSVAAPLCLWADALTKVVALSGDAADPLLDRYAALAWVH